jgi:valyl-tRNA synthetase
MSKSVGNVLDPLAVVEGRTIDRIIQEIEADSKEEIELGKSLNTKAGEKQAKVAQTLVRNKIKEAQKTFQQGITESGSDPLRMALIDYTRQSRQINMELRHIDTFRRLGIKIDNAFKFFHNSRKPSDKAFGTAIEGSSRTSTTIKSWIEGLDKKKTRLHDWYILYYLRELVGVCNTAFEERKLYKATEAIRAFTFDVLCDVYLEFVKEELGDENVRVSISSPQLMISLVDTNYPSLQRREIAMGMTFHALDVTLRLTHPFMPFITEGLWQELDPRNRAEVDGTSIMLSTFPSVGNFPDIEFSQAEPMKSVLELVESLRRSSHDVSSSPDKRSKKVASILPPQDGSLTEYLKEKKETLARLSRVEIRMIFSETRWNEVEADPVGSADGWAELSQSIDSQDGVLVIGRRTNTQ